MAASPATPTPLARETLRGLITLPATSSQMYCVPNGTRGLWTRLYRSGNGANEFLRHFDNYRTLVSTIHSVGSSSLLSTALVHTIFRFSVLTPTKNFTNDIQSGIITSRPHSSLNQVIGSRNASNVPITFCAIQWEWMAGEWEDEQRWTCDSHLRRSYYCS